jgi:hypothetical protein
MKKDLDSSAVRVAELQEIALSPIAHSAILFGADK